MKKGINSHVHLSLTVYMSNWLLHGACAISLEVSKISQTFSCSSPIGLSDCFPSRFSNGPYYFGQEWEIDILRGFSPGKILETYWTKGGIVRGSPVLAAKLPKVFAASARIAGLLYWFERNRSSRGIESIPAPPKRLNSFLLKISGF